MMNTTDNDTTALQELQEMGAMDAVACANGARDRSEFTELIEEDDIYGESFTKTEAYLESQKNVGTAPGKKWFKAWGIFKDGTTVIVIYSTSLYSDPKLCTQQRADIVHDALDAIEDVCERKSNLLALNVVNSEYDLCFLTQ